MSPQPPRDDGWTCPICRSWNESFRTTCRNASMHGQPDEED